MPSNTTRTYNKEAKGKYYLEHREYLKQKSIERYYANIDHYRERNCLRTKIKTKENRYKVFQRLGFSCVKCGFNDIRALQFDHINGGGSKERRSMRPYLYYAHLLEDPDLELKIQVLCANCNIIKVVENGEYNDKYGHSISIETQKES